MNQTRLSTTAPDSDATPITTPIPFVAYTHFPKAEAELERLLARIPLQMPDAWRDKWVAYGPWLQLLFLPFQLYAVFALLIFGSFALLLGDPMVIPSTVLSFASLACGVIAVPGLFKRSRVGWRFQLYAAALTLVDCALGLDVGLVLLTIVLIWAVFQIKYRYS